jgi:putative Holliday junction resolvase
MPNQLLMGFDFGLKHIGVAIGQTITGTASPLTTIAAQNGLPDWKTLDTLISDWQPTTLVVGLPLNMDGSMSDMAHRAQHFAKQLEERYHKPSHCVDERLTTQAAEQWFLEHHARHPSKGELDALSAVIILEGFLSEF